MIRYASVRNTMKTAQCSVKLHTVWEQKLDTLNMFRASGGGASASESVR
jgi:hypothetical protein